MKIRDLPNASGELVSLRVEHEGKTSPYQMPAHLDIRDFVSGVLGKTWARAVVTPIPDGIDITARKKTCRVFAIPKIVTEE